MRIAYKLPLSLIAFMAAFGAAMLAFEQRIVVPGLRQIELDLARRDQDRVLAAIDREAQHLALLARDWGQWDDTWRYAGGEEPGFVGANIDGETFKTTKVDLIAIYAGSRTPLYAARFDPSSSSIAPLRAFPADADALFPFSRGQAELGDLAGLLRSGDATYIIASSPIVKSDGGGGVRGSFVMGRLVDDRIASALSEQTGVALTLEGDGFLGEGDRALAPSADGKAIEGRMVIGDLAGKPALVALTKRPRDISERSLGTVGIFRDALFACCLFLSILLIVGLYRLVSRPIAGIRQQIGLIGDGCRIEMPEWLALRKDEVGDLAKAFSELSAKLSQKRQELESINARLEAMVAERTFELSLLAKVVDSTGESVVITDLDGNIVKVNEAFCQSSGYSAEELLGRNPRILKSGRHEREFYARMWASIASDGTWSGEIWDRRKSGELFPKWLTINRIVDADGKARNYVGVSADITDLKASEERLQRLAYFDPLTGLPNRALFRDRLDKATARSMRFGSRMALIFIDLDRFKYVNDTMGHAVGDELLVEVARRLRGSVREADSVCRLGGDEFTLILEQLGSSEDAARIAEIVLAELAEPMNLGGSQVFIGASMGIAVFPFDETSADGLIRKADAAMYCAKEAGRNTYRFVSGRTDSVNRERLEIDRELHRALEQSELVLFYQPILDPTGAEIRGAEALLRWKRPGDDEPSLVDRSISLAEESGLIVKIGDFVMREACRQAIRWSVPGRKVRVSVNVSSKQLESAGLARLVQEALEGSGLPPGLFEIELTESTLMSDPEASLRTLIELKDMGVGISIDDFGTGYASLSYLNLFPVDRLKIDRAFVAAIGTSRKASALVDALLFMARSLDISTIAEGVETEEQRRFLADKGCSELQGFLFSEPVPPERFSALLAGREAS